MSQFKFILERLVLLEFQEFYNGSQIFWHHIKKILFVCIFYKTLGNLKKNLLHVNVEATFRNQMRVPKCQVPEYKHALEEVADTTSGSKIKSDAQSIATNELENYEFILSLILYGLKY